jgi:hypothetical protein
MSKDQIIGVILLIASIIGIIVYGYLIYMYPLIIMQITLFIAVAAVGTNSSMDRIHISHNTTTKTHRRNRERNRKGNERDREGGKRREEGRGRGEKGINNFKHPKSF